MKYEIVDSEFNRKNYPDMIGKVMDSPPAYANVKLVDEQRTPMEQIFRLQSRLFQEEVSSDMLEDFVIKCLRAGYNKDEIIEGIGKFFRQCEEVAQNIFTRAVVKMKGIKPPKESDSDNWYKKAQIPPQFRDVRVRRLMAILSDFKDLAKNAEQQMLEWLEKQEYDISIEEAKDRLRYELTRMNIE